MHCLFLNIRGFGVPGRQTLIKELLRTKRIDVVCLQETIKREFSDPELRGMEVGEKFFWSWLPACGYSGGMLMGVRDNMFEVGSLDMGSNFISLEVLHRPTNLKYWLINVYSPADHSKMEEFLYEISGKIARCQSPIIMGRDFNLIRGRQDKNNDRALTGLGFSFSTCTLLTGECTSCSDPGLATPGPISVLTRCDASSTESSFQHVWCCPSPFAR